MGIRTPVSTNYAITLGGLKQGVTALDLAHAYETFATGGVLVTGTLGTAKRGPVGIRRVERNVDRDGDGRFPLVRINRRVTDRILGRKTARVATQLLTGPVKFGTAKRAQYGGFAAGKTGTTENNGDAWFVGFTDRFTIAVWVGYPDRLQPMETEFMGDEVTGGTFPALIWRDVVLSMKQIIEQRISADRAAKGLPPLPTGPTGPATPGVEEPVEPEPSTTGPGGVAAPGETAPTTTTTKPKAKPKEPEPEPEPEPTPAPQTTTPQGGGTSSDPGGTGAPPA
jgi:penicillin-binding protein 1A